MNITQLEYFLVTAKYGSFSRTANAYYTSQPTVSRQIQMLEEELGYALFDRTSKPLQLTEAGKVFNEGLPAIMQAMDNIRRKGQLAAKGNYGTINVAFPTGLNIEDTYAALLMDIMQSIPGLRVNYQKMDQRLLKESLLSGRTDLTVTLHTPAMDDDELTFTDLEQLQSYVVMSPEHPLASRNSLEEEDLIGQKFYLIAPFSGYSYHREKLLGFHLKGTDLIEVDNISTALLNVRFGGGLTIANSYMSVLLHNEDYRTFPALDNSKNPYVSIISCLNNTNPAVAIFRDLLRDYHMRNRRSLNHHLPLNL